MQWNVAEKVDGQWKEKTFLEIAKKISSYVFATDEVGRGPLAGPVISGTVCLDLSNDDLVDKVLTGLKELGINDSKKLTPKKRKKIIEALLNGISLDDLKLEKSYSFFEGSLQLVLTESTPEEIDQMNILQASKWSMVKGIKHFKRKGVALIDGNQCLKAMEYELPLIKGDSRSLLIGLASIFAKEYRDHLMLRLSEIYPGYGLENHAGYPTPTHKAAIESLGPSPIHRKSFKGVKEFVS